MFAFARITLAQQFLLASLMILLTGMAVIGIWVGRQIETGVVNRTGGVTALYVDSFIAPQLQGFARGEKLSESNLSALDSLLTDTPLGRRVVTFKIWDLNGTVRYSNNRELIGRRFEIRESLRQAMAGDVKSEISHLEEEENALERAKWTSLIETYAPVRAESTDRVIAIAEFYQTTDELRQEVRSAQWRSWLAVALATLAMYLLLAGLVGRASLTLVAQQNELRGKVDELEGLLAQNRLLHERVRRAAERVTALNERYLRRISADLHDGLAQDLSFALLRLDTLGASLGRAAREGAAPSSAPDDFSLMQTALRSGLSELRALTAGLRLPELGQLSLPATIERAIGDFERKSGHTVQAALDGVAGQASLPLKITIYRLVQESLANGFRHGQATTQRVAVTQSADNLSLEIADNGQGFDPAAAVDKGRLGVEGMRERVEILGGTFRVESKPGKGTTVIASLPFTGLADDHG